MQDSKPGQIFYQDLTVDNSENVGNFYHVLLRWEKEVLKFGDYKDYIIKRSKNG